MIVFGPVPSRRLGQSLGVNNIPPKICSYSCVYCQIGRTKKMTAKRSGFYKPENIYREVKSKINQLKDKGEHIDYITFVPDGEPTLDINLGMELGLMQSLGVKTAVITNASLLWQDEVKNDLLKADLVSVKIDAVFDDVWHQINRPHGALRLHKILDGIEAFAKIYRGVLVTETMLVEGINDSRRHMESIAEQIAKINPQKSYILVPTRPPAEKNIRRPGSEKLIEAAGIINAVSGVNVKCITADDDEQGFFFTDDVATDLLNITSVHPIREEIVNHYIKVKNKDNAILKKLINENRIIKYTFEGKIFYKKNLNLDNKKVVKNENIS